MTDVVLLDGGMGQELIARSNHPLHPMWSAQAMLLEPDIVREAHLDFIRAGARALTINAYAATQRRLKRDGDLNDFIPLQRAACQLANDARREAGETGENVLLTGCLPPLEGSYHPEAIPPYEQTLSDYREIAALQAPHVDVMLAETMSAITEGRAAAVAMAETGKPVWVAWTLSDEPDAIPRLRSGEPLKDAIAALADLPIDAMLINCCRPEKVGPALPLLATSGRRFGAYPNAFSDAGALALGGTVDALDVREDLGPAAYAEAAMDWIADGATLIGGCCEIGPAHIQALTDRIAAAGLPTVPAV